MTDQTENPNASAQDDIKTVLQDTLFQQVQTLLNFTHTDGFALQIPETDTLILTGPLTRIAEFIQREIATPAASFASQSQAAQPTEWQPIESAPKDGRTLLLGCFNTHGRWRTMRGQWFSEAAIAEDWEDPDDAKEGWYETAVEPDVPNCWSIDPTHWMPLPVAPGSHIAGTSQATKVQAEPILLRKKFFDLPLGTRFRYVGGKEEWVVLERHGRGKVAGYQPHDGWVAGQSIFSFADSEEECRALEVDVVLAAPVAKEAPEVLEGATNCTLNGGDANGNQVFVSMDSKPSTHLWTVGGRAYLCEAGPVASVAKEATLHNVRPGTPTASQVQADEAKLYRTLTGDAMNLGFGSISAALGALRKVKEAPAVPELTVWYGSMPESNGKSNFTAILTRKDAKGLDVFGGFTIARSEYPDRVRYEADSMRYLIGELAERPDILDYDADKHSGYVKPVASVAVDATREADVQRYQRLRILGAAPYGTGQLAAGNVLRFQSLDGFLDADIAAHPSRGEFSKKAEKQEHVMPPFAAPAGQRDANGAALIDVRYEFEKWMSDRGESTTYIGDGIYSSGAVCDQAEAFAAGVELARRFRAQGGITNTNDSGSDLATTTSTVSAPHDFDRAEFIRRLVLSVAEIPDRNSPEDQPEMMLVTDAELRDCATGVFEEMDEEAELAAEGSTEGAQKAPEDVRNTILDEAIAAVPGGSICDPQQVADAIRALKRTSTDQANADTPASKGE